MAIILPPPSQEPLPKPCNPHDHVYHSNNPTPCHTLHVVLRRVAVYASYVHTGIRSLQKCTRVDGMRLFFMPCILLGLSFMAVVPGVPFSHSFAMTSL